MGIVSSQVSVVQRGRVHDQNTQTTHRNSSGPPLRGILCYAHLDSFKIFIFLDPPASPVLTT